MARRDHPETPDGRYFVARGLLWRKSDPRLDEGARRRYVKELMKGRRAVRLATTPEEERAAREQVDRAKRALGERGPVWWDDGAPDETMTPVERSRYAEWWRARGDCGGAD